VVVVAEHMEVVAEQVAYYIIPDILYLLELVTL
jgi:hypothetical protein